MKNEKPRIPEEGDDAGFGFITEAEIRDLSEQELNRLIAKGAIKASGGQTPSPEYLAHLWS